MMEIRQFKKSDLADLYDLLKDPLVNTYLPWWPLTSLEMAKDFYRKHFSGTYKYAIVCDKHVIGFITVSDDEHHEIGYALKKEYWHQGLATKALIKVMDLLKKEGIAYVTATHDRDNQASGAVLKRVGMHYCYSYKELWQPKNKQVVFRMYQKNLSSLASTDLSFGKVGSHFYEDIKENLS